MSNEDKPDPLDDVKKGFGLLFRAAKTAVEKLPTKGLEDAVLSGAREVGRAVENVATTIEQTVFNKPKPAAPASHAPPPPSASSASSTPGGEPATNAPPPSRDAKPDAAQPPPAAGPRVDTSASTTDGKTF